MTENPNFDQDTVDKKPNSVAIIEYFLSNVTEVYGVEISAKCRELLSQVPDPDQLSQDDLSDLAWQAHWQVYQSELNAIGDARSCSKFKLKPRPPVNL